MEKAYRNISYFFLLIFVVAILGFYQTYFGLFPRFRGVPDIAHLHALGFLLWFALLIIQPLLIRYNQLALHRSLGKFSYFLVPYIVLTVFGMMENGYHRDGVEWFLATNPPVFFFAVAGITNFVLFYLLAIVYRRNAAYHMRYIISASLALLAPALGRLFGPELHMPIMAAAVPSVVAPLILIGLIVLDWVKLRKAYTPYLYALELTILIDVAIPTIPRTRVWQSIALIVARHM
jgi:hypothetical protein